MALADLLKTARDHFYSTLGTVNTTLANQPDFLDVGRQQARAAFHEKLNAIFSADFQSIISSAGSVADRLTQLISASAKQKSAYSTVFTEQVDLDAASQEAFGALKDSLKKVLA